MDYLRLKKSNCKNCYKCIRHCPVKSIKFSGNQAHILGDECILCGQCFVVCPQNAKEIAGSREAVKVLLESGAPVIASVAPSFAANYDGVGIEAIEAALKKLGFAGAEETAVGATFVKRRYEEILREQKPEILISSCCHSVNLLIQKYFPALTPCLAPVVSPMEAHCTDIKSRIPNAKTVFIGPCLAKKDEANRFEGGADEVLTFEELTEWLNSEGIELEANRPDNEKSRARLFPVCGGILKTMVCDQSDYTYMAIDGAENCIAALKDIESGGLRGCFIEMSSCIGSCIGGPVMEKYHRSPVRGYRSVSTYAGRRDFEAGGPARNELARSFEYMDVRKPSPSEAEINDVLRKMGKYKPEHELNCGSCGYDTCREKAKAVIAGKADYTMCLSYLMEREESFSDSIIKNTTNAILVLNDDLEVQQINKAACELFNLRGARDVLGEQVVCILDPKPFIDAKAGRMIHDEQVYLAEYKRFVEQSVTYDREYRIIICIMRDITIEQTEREHKETISRQTIEVADKVVEKQMRIVQEIASLLGETAAETKIALTKLKESIKDE